MKVLITVPRLRVPGGVASYYSSLRSHLDADKVYFEIGSIPGETSRRQRILRLITDYRCFFRTLRNDRFDLVHINPSIDVGLTSLVRDGILLLIAKLACCPVLVFYRGWIPAAAEDVQRRFRRLFRYVYGKADASVVLANQFRETLLQLGIREPIFVETTTVGDSAFVAHSPMPDPGRRCCNILFLSRLDRGKGGPEAIRAFAALQASRSDVVLTIAGDGPDRATVEREVNGLGLANVTFLGHVAGDAKHEAFRQADIYLFTSLAEGMPNSVLEAMAHGLPVVTRPVGGIRDFFEEGRMGYAPDGTDPGVFAEALRRLVDDPQLRASMGTYNRDFARQRFAAVEVAQRLLGIYSRVIADTRRTA